MLSFCMVENDGYPRQILRDYLYVDVEKVKSIAGQLEYGVPEESRLTSKDSSRTSVGWNKVLSYSPESGSESYVNRSMLDSLFPELEDALEDGWLTDISDIFSEDNEGVFNRIKSACPEGSLFRLTADGFLFDSAFLGAILSNLSVTLSGYEDFVKALQIIQEVGAPAVNQKGKKPARNSVGDGAEVRGKDEFRLEDKIEQFSAEYGYSVEFLKGILKTSRGLFSPGLNIVQFNSGERNSMIVTARLMENRRYLDADAHSIGRRFGSSSQTWTLVGTVGHYSQSPAEIQARTERNNALAQEVAGSFDRNNFVRIVNGVIEDVAATGLTDLPQHPALSVIPIAVYRVMERKAIS